MFLILKTWKVNLFAFGILAIIYLVIFFNFNQIKKTEAEYRAKTFSYKKVENLKRTEEQKENINNLFISLSKSLNNKIDYINKLFKNEDTGIKTYTDDYCNIYINKKDENSLIVEVVVYYANGIDDLIIGKTTIIDIEKYLGEPNYKEYSFKYVYEENKNKTSFLFDEGGVLRNIVFNQI